jgi:F0F1-type ATP synthase membrane subunit b/b'
MTLCFKCELYQAAKRDAEEAEAYAAELETKLAKLRTFLDELWDSQGYDARELHDLLKELDGYSDD